MVLLLWRSNKRFNHLLHLNIGGVFFAKTHYSSILMTTLWAAPYLIIISKDDETLVRYLVKEAHILQLPENVGTALHLPQHLTINRVLSSTLCPAFVSELRRIESDFISNCLYCQKVMARGGKFRPYHHILSDPWISVKMRKFDASTTFFSRISLDNINVKVRHSQTRKSDWCNLALIFGLDCATSYFSVHRRTSLVANL